jgi:hypothetical protein
VFDPAAGTWTDLSAALSGTPPSPRRGHGFTSAGGKLYVHGGWDGSGEGARGDGGGQAGRRDVLPRDRRRGRLAGMGQDGMLGEAGTRGGLVAAASPESSRGAGWRGPRRRA